MGIFTTKTVTEAKTVSIIAQMLSLNQWREDHPLQRKADQWSTSYRDGFIATVAKNEDFDSIKLCVEDGVTYIVDGKQRLSTIKKFRNDVFKLGNNIELPIVEYLDSSGDIKEFDLRKKKYSQFPPELQLQFDSCQIMTVKHLSCTREETAYHIRRYNHGKCMSAPQIGVTYTDRFAQDVKKISDHNRFFLDCGNYTNTQRKNGTLDKIVMESIIGVFHLDNWKKQADKMGLYINDNATEDQFNMLNEFFTRLIPLCEGKYKSIFNNKNTFLFIAAFDRFTRFGLEDCKFAEFLDKFEEELHSKAFKDEDGNDISWDILNKKTGTKDKTVVTDKIEFLERLMMDYFGISKEDVEVKSDEEFIANVVDMEVKEVREDMVFYNETLDDLLRTCVRYDSKLLAEENRLSLLAMMVYSFKEDIDLEQWLTAYAVKNNTYIKNPRRNFEIMRNSCRQFVASA